MTPDPYPNGDDLQQLAEAHTQLAAAGVPAGSEGYDLDALAAATYTRGWAYRIDRPAGMPGFQVELRTQNGVARQPLVIAVGWEPEVAFALALAQALQRQVRRSPRPSGESAAAAVE